MMMMMTMNMIVLVMWKARTQMATPKWFLVALSQCQPGQIATPDPADEDEYDEDEDNEDEDNEDGDHDYVLDEETDNYVICYWVEIWVTLVECR